MSNTKGTSAIVAPSGGGAQSGLGEKFSPDLFTGTGNFSVPISVPPARNGVQPELTLGYSTGNGNGTFGMGWALGVSGITRKTNKGIPIYDDRKDIFVLSGAEDLVPIKEEKETLEENEQVIHWERTYYKPRTEGLFARIVHHKKKNNNVNLDYWEVRSKGGLTSFYGESNYPSDDSSIIANPENRKAIFAWTLSKVVDSFGNEMIYEYERELLISQSKAQPHSSDQLYLSSIKYNQYYIGDVKKYLCEVCFEYEERPDAFSVYRQGFEIRTTKRCKSVSTYTHADETRKVKTYHFNYLEELPLNGVSLLKEVSVEGHKGDESEWMPPLEFGYSTFKPSIRGLDEIKGPIPSLSLAQPGYELVDVTGNGLPDLLQMDGTGTRYWPNKGKGVFASPKTIPVSPSIQLGSIGVQLIDANGDGRNDLLVVNGTQAGYFSGSFNDVWDKKNYRSYPKKPSFSLTDPEVQFMDLDGDGITDVLRNGAKFECFLNDPEKGFDQLRLADKTFADFSFADPRIRFADMTGDGLQDIVLISSGRVQYWPNLGYGRFGKMVNMINAPRFPEQFNPKQILLGDLDGDGQADIAFVENNRVTLYVNQSGNSFSQGVKIVGTPAVHQVESLRIADIMGTGKAGIVWSQIVTNGTKGRMFFLDFTGGNKPYLLEEMNNNSGSITHVTYGSSIEHFLRDDQDPQTRWKTQLPFPVLVVNRLEYQDLLSGGKMVTEYSYHNGYWDGAEREFRGFAQVDTKDTESFERFTSNPSNGKTVNNLNNPIHLTPEYYSPPVQTKSWFYLGPVGPDYTNWHEVDFSDQYWQGDTNVFERTNEMKSLLASLSRRARRDALRTLKGTVLRSETYGLDNSSLQDKPYTVTESLMSVQLEFDPFHPSVPLLGETFVFFPFNISQRTTQYERGNDPMHNFTFNKGYDSYGNSQGGLSVGLPRGCAPLNGGNGDYLGVYNFSEFIYKDIADGQYMVDRVKKSVSYDATKPATNLNVFEYRDLIFNSSTLPVIGYTVNFYDGEVYEGLPFGQIGNHGSLVRSETLVITDEQIDSAYGANTPECFKSIPDWSNINGYPAAFEGLLQNGDVHLGYKDRRDGYPNHFPGWYAEGTRTKYDWQEFNELTDPLPVGLALESMDVFDNRTTVEYDVYQYLPVKTKKWLNSTEYFETIAEYDYRTLQVNRMTDPNNNSSVFDFSPLGLLKATALIGKGTEGDYKSNTGNFYERYAPSMQIEYDFFAFVNEGNPIWIKTIQREEYYQQNPNSPTIVKVEYTDGFGRLLQTRSQAEDLIFGNQTFGTSGLPADQNAVNAPAVGIERNENDPLNVLVNGWTIYNNKGKAVEQYEPFFDKGFDYSLPQLSAVGGIVSPQQGMKARMYYDTAGRAVRTVNPDNSEQRVVFGIPDQLDTPDAFTPTPWENYAYDSNDLSPLTHPINNPVPESHWYTPVSNLIDVLGRTIQTVQHMSYYNADTDLYENLSMNYLFDIQGNTLVVFDCLNRKVFENKYNLSQQLLWSKHIDGGEGTVLFDGNGKVIKSKDAKGATVLNAYDGYSRSLFLWAKDKEEEEITLRQIFQYGDSSGITNPEIQNLKGQVYRNYDEAGRVEIPEYDFKGNMISTKRQFISDTQLLSVFSSPPVDWDINCYRVDWTGLPSILDTKVFETNFEYDALNRLTKFIYPEDADNIRKELLPTYNRGGGLTKVSCEGIDYVTQIAYNAKGQRLLIAYGNDIMTRYVYDNRTSRLLRLKSEKYVQSDYTFTPQSGTTKQDLGHINDLVGNILTINDRTPNGGVGGTNSLSRSFEYDPLYRLTMANGRENNPAASFPWWDDVYRSTDNSTTTAYTQHYKYDKLGNIQSLQHIGDNLFTRNFEYSATDNRLNSITVGLNSCDYLYDSSGNQIQENSSRFFEWSFGNQLRCFYNQAGTSEPTIYAQYLYDGSGNRVKKIVRTQGGDYESICYIGGTFEYKTNGTDEQTTAHIMDSNSRIATTREGADFGDTTPEVKYNLEDHLGSSTVLLETNGSLINKEEYYPFGETSFGSYAKKRYRFSGKEKDEESGLYYYGARYYMAWACKFISCDPMSAKLTQWSSYVGFNDNPIRYIDPEGLEGTDWVGEKNETGGMTWKWIPQSFDSEGAAKAAGYDGWNGKSFYSDNIKLPDGYIGPATMLEGGGYSKGAPQELDEVEVVGTRMTQRQIDATFNPEKEIIYGRPEEALRPQWEKMADAEAAFIRRRRELDNLFNGLDNLALGSFAVAFSAPFVIGGAIVYSPVGIGTLTKTGYGLYRGVKKGYELYDKYVSKYVDESGIAYNYVSQSISTGNWGVGNKDLIGGVLSGINLDGAGKFKTPLQSILGTSGAFIQYTPNKGLQTIGDNSKGYFFGSLVNGALQPVLSNSRYGNNFSSTFIFGTSQLVVNVYDDGKHFSE